MQCTRNFLMKIGYSSNIYFTPVAFVWLFHRAIEQVFMNKSYAISVFTAPAPLFFAYFPSWAQESVFHCKRNEWP